MFSFTRLARLGLAAAFATTLAAGVAKAETLVMAIANTPASLDGDQALSAEGEMMMANIHGGDLFLYKIIEQPDKSADSVDLRSTDDRAVVGLVAESWEMSEDGTSVTINLKKGVKSYAGNEFTAEDYKWAWARRFEVKGVGKFNRRRHRHQRCGKHRDPRHAQGAGQSARHDADLLQDPRAELLRRPLRFD